MGTRHWDDSELIERLYGLGPQDGHLEECQVCAGRWQALLATRGQVLRRSASEELLAHAPNLHHLVLERPARRFRWLTYASATVTAVVLLAVLLYRPAPVRNPIPPPSDAEFFADIYSIAGNTEPAAAEPIHALFEVEP